MDPIMESMIFDLETKALTGDKMAVIRLIGIMRNIRKAHDTLCDDIMGSGSLTVATLVKYNEAVISAYKENVDTSDKLQSPGEEH